MKSYMITGGGGIPLHLLETGNSRGRPIVFIHGFSQSGLAWTRQMNSELADSYRLVAMDLRGHGLSDKPREGYADSREVRTSCAPTIGSPWSPRRIRLAQAPEIPAWLMSLLIP
jgi:pimeloyl-ACP methyl ester carboxylesterase